MPTSYLFVSEVFLLCMFVPLSYFNLWLHICTFVACSSNPALSIEKTFQLTRADKDLLLKQEFDLQVGDHLM